MSHPTPIGAWKEARDQVRLAVARTTAVFGRVPCPQCGGVVTWWRIPGGDRRRTGGMCSTAHCIVWKDA